jgi:hypothetical protein
MLIAEQARRQLTGLAITHMPWSERESLHQQSPGADACTMNTLLCTQLAAVESVGAISMRNCLQEAKKS